MPGGPRAASAWPRSDDRVRRRLPAPPALVGRIVRSADFERVLARAPCSRSTHFAAHHLAASPVVPARASPSSGVNKLSTGIAPICLQPVDDSPPKGHWLGCVVPKRQARRAVTRSLIKRSMREALQRLATRLPPGLWVLRLRAGFGKEHFPSARSVALQSAVRDELIRLLDRCSIAPTGREQLGATP